MVLFRKTTMTVNTATLGIFAFCFLLLALNCNKGLDITDRSYYLLWADQAENVTGSLTHFGFVTGLIYDLVGQDIAAFRLAGLLILISLAFALAWGLHGFLEQRFSKQVLPLSFFHLVLAVLCGSLFYYHRWLQAPSYNWLALASTMVTLIGLFRFSAGSKVLPSALAVALGGVLALIAKPTTAMALAVLAPAFVLFQHPGLRAWKFIFSSAFMALLFFWGFSFFCFGSVQAYLNHLDLGRELSMALSYGYTLSETLLRSGREIYSFFLWWLKSSFVHLYLGVLLVYVFLRTFKKDSWWTKCFGYVLPVSLLFLMAYLGYRLQSGQAGFFLSTILLSLLGLLFCTAAGLLVADRQPGQMTDQIRGQIGLGGVLALFLIAVSMSPAFGTGSDLVSRMSQYAIFLAAAGSIMLQLISPAQIKSVVTALWGLGLGLLLFFMLMHAYQYPYRLPTGIKYQDKSTSLLGDELKLDEKTAGYVKELSSQALQAGWEPGTPLIDMTGGSPGALVILQARILGTPWLLGSYPGSDNFAQKALASEKHRLLEKAWVLTAPKGQRGLSREVLHKNGLDFPESYVRVGSLTTGHRREKQLLWKPVLRD